MKPKFFIDRLKKELNLSNKYLFSANLVNHILLSVLCRTFQTLSATKVLLFAKKVKKRTKFLSSFPASFKYQKNQCTK